jgi:hypothetical protein
MYPVRGPLNCSVCIRTSRFQTAAIYWGYMRTPPYLLVDLAWVHSGRAHSTPTPTPTHTQLLAAIHRHLAKGGQALVAGKVSKHTIHATTWIERFYTSYALRPSLSSAPHLFSTTLTHTHARTHTTSASTSARTGPFTTWSIEPESWGSTPSSHAGLTTGGPTSATLCS